MGCSPSLFRSLASHSDREDRTLDPIGAIDPNCGPAAEELVAVSHHYRGR